MTTMQLETAAAFGERLASQARVAKGSSAVPSPAGSPLMASLPAMPTRPRRIALAHRRPRRRSSNSRRSARLPRFRVIRVAIFDQLECGHGAGDGRRDLIARSRARRRPASAPSSSAISLSMRRLTKSPRAAGWRGVDRPGKDRAAAGMRDPHQLLHHLGGGAILAPATAP